MLAGAPDALAVIDASSGVAWTYRALAAEVGAAAQRLVAAAGAGPAFLFARNDLATVIELLAALTAGVPIAVLAGDLDDARAAALIARYRPTAILGRALAPAPGGPRPHADLGLLLSTSGSTGHPKLVRLSAAAVIANARAIAAALDLGPGQVAPTSLPLAYSFGLSIVTSHLVAGATVVVTDAGLLEPRFWATCRAHHVTSLAGVPYSYQLLRRLDLAQVAPPSLTTLTQAGGRLDPSVVRHVAGLAAARGGGLYVMYGQTEAAARIAVLPPRELPAAAGAVGWAVPGGAIAIDGGEVIYRGPNVMLGYAESVDDLAVGDVQGGVLRTGDRGYLDDRGRLWLTGRVGRHAKVFGLRVDLDELEAVARAVPGVDAAAALAGDDRVRIAIEGAGPEVLAAVRAALAAHVGVHPSGFAVAAVAALPRQPSGKIDYSRLDEPAP